MQLDATTIAAVGAVLLAVAALWRTQSSASLSQIEQLSKSNKDLRDDNIKANQEIDNLYRGQRSTEQQLLTLRLELNHKDVQIGLLQRLITEMQEHFDAAQTKTAEKISQLEQQLDKKNSEVERLQTQVLERDNVIAQLNERLNELERINKNGNGDC